MIIKQLILIISLSCIFTTNVYSKKLIVAVIDTGFGYNKQSFKESHLCKYGHRDFTKDKKFTARFNTKEKIPLDLNSHGTNVVGIIDKVAGKSNYCFVIVKLFSGPNGISDDKIAYENAIRYTIALNPDIINYSAGGTTFNQVEYIWIKKYLDRHSIFITSAGNNGQELGVNGNVFYPAMYDSRICVVGNIEKNGKRHSMSNYGNLVNFWEFGVNVKAFGITDTGTSQATAVHTGRVIKELNGTQSH